MIGECVELGTFCFYRSESGSIVGNLAGPIRYGIVAWSLGLNRQ
jgi:hypothetical protein